MKITVKMQDVARAANVSITTVSHVVNDTRPIAPATRARVLKAIKKLNYYKNSSARLLVRGYSDAVGLIISDIENPFYPQLIKGFERACQAERLELILGMTNYTRPNAEASVRRMIEDKVRGVAIMSTEFDPKLVERLLDRNMPVVRLDDPQLRHNQSSVHIDYSAGVEQAVEHLASLQHRDVAIIHRPQKVLSARRYRQSLIDAVERHGMRLLSCIEQESHPAGGIAGIQELVANKIYPSAILCGNDLIAIGAMGEASRLGWQIPRDVSIIGSDDIAFAVYGHPPLSTVRVQKDEVGLCAFRLLQQMFEDKKNRGSAVNISTQFIPRGSTAPARSTEFPASMPSVSPEFRIG
ncbi:MAG TPA: LacI family DNA-binding transcriptional regulator [Terracidiphilus sp.]|nr:LacI family DNA-binding transcriptional regulator [Terracidiphilus sp.]